MFKRFFLLFLVAFTAVTAAEPALIPWPKTVQLDGGKLTLTGRIVATDPSLAPLAKVLTAEIDRMTGVKLATADGAARDRRASRSPRWGVWRLSSQPTRR